MDETTLDRLAELANIGAGHAANAFTTLTGHTIVMRVPRLRRAGSSYSARGEAGGDTRTWTTGVFFEFEGYLDALVGILFHRSASEAVVRRVAGVEEGDVPAQFIESALMEVGNILASHVASAIADTVGRRLLPSIPTLAMNCAEQQLDAMLARRPAASGIRIECELEDASGELGGLLVLIPDRPSLGATCAPAA